MKETTFPGKALTKKSIKLKSRQRIAVKDPREVLYYVSFLPLLAFLKRLSWTFLKVQETRWAVLLEKFDVFMKHS